jgi:hypothetical protein
MKSKVTLRILIIALLILGSGPMSLARTQLPADSHLRLLSSDGQSILLELIVDGFQTETADYEGQTYHRLIIPGMVQTDTPGEPQVPTRGTLLGLPAAEGVSVHVIDANYETLRGYHLYPAPAVQMTKDNLDDLMAEDVPQTFALDQDLYAADAFYPGKPVEIGHTGTMRDQAIAQVQFYPVQYNPVTAEVRLYRRILARVTWAMPLSIAATETRGPSPAYEKLLQSALLNYDALERPPVTEPTSPIGAADTGIGAASITPTLKIGVTEDGIYQLTPTALIGAGFNLSGIDLNTIKISNRGAEIPIYVHDSNSNHAFDGNDCILFYGTAITDNYTVKNVYWLTAGGADGLRMSTRDGTPGSAMLAEQFPATLHAEEDTYYWQTMPDGEGQDHWFWGGRLAPEAAPSRVYTLTLNHLSTAASTATVRVRLKGGTDNPYLNPDHNTKISLNDLEIGGLHQWDGFSIYDQEATVPHSELNEGSNTVKVELAGTTYQQLYVNWIEIDYWDTYIAEDDRLLFGAPAPGAFQFEVTGFSADGVQVFDVTDPSNTAIISNTTVVPDAGGGYKLQFEDSAQPETRYLALTAAQRKSPASIDMDQSSSWKSTALGADYIIITHKDFYTSALRLAEHREAPDMRVATVKVEDIYDEFNYGIFNPQAIRDFLSYAYHNWVSPAPTYVLLFGDASQDYKDNLNTGSVNYVPSQVIETDLMGQTFSDNWFVAIDGPDDILPDMFIGRLTARTTSQADDMVDKIISYEQNPPDASWNRNVLLVADDETPFEAISEQLADRLPYYYTANKVYASDYPPGDPTIDIANQINNGSLLVNYAGHGGVDIWGRWSGGYIFNRYPNVTSLNNTGKLPMVTAANCLNGYFTGSKISMADEFLRLKNKGAVAVWAATSLGYASGHRELMREFYEAIFQDDLYAMGTATTAAKISTYGLNNFWGEMVETFVLFGDPAVQLGLPTNYPYVKSTTPANGASKVPLDQDIQIVFNKPMSPTTVVLSGPGTTGLVFTPTWSADYTLLNFDHTDFDESEMRTFTVEGQDKLGNSLRTGPVPNLWSFTTVVLRPNDVTIIGSTAGITQTQYTFVADLSPNTATQPITYEWQATGQAPTTHPGGGLIDTVNFTWYVTGTQAITVTATNTYGIVTGTHVITISDILPGANTVYLPIVIKND